MLHAVEVYPELVGAVGNGRQLDGKVEHSHALERVGLVQRPCLSVGVGHHRLVELGVVAVEHLHVVEVIYRVPDARGRLAGVQGRNLADGGAAEPVVHCFAAERQGVKAQPLVEHPQRHLSVVEQYPVERVDVAVERPLHGVEVHADALGHHLVHGVGAKRLHPVGQRVVAHIPVEQRAIPARGLVVHHPGLDERLGQHGLVVVVGLAEPPVAHVCVLLEGQYVGVHRRPEHVVGHKHVQHVVLLGIVIARVNGDVVVPKPVVPALVHAPLACGALAVPLPAPLRQVGQRMYAVDMEHSIGLGKEREAALAHRRRVVARHGVGRRRCQLLVVFGQQGVDARGAQRLVEDGEVGRVGLQLLHHHAV